MFVSSTLRYADAEYANPHEWSATLNGVPVNAVSANDERGFVDVVVTLDRFEPLGTCTCRGEDQCESCFYVVHRLFGDVRIGLSSESQLRLFTVGKSDERMKRFLEGDWVTL
jgi:hypothetical protein